MRGSGLQNPKFWTLEFAGPEAHAARWDPWSIGHFLFGLMQAWMAPSLMMGFPTNLCTQLAWEALENSSLYLRTTRRLWPSQDYHGDTYLNSGGDVLSWSLGYWVGVQARARAARERLILYMMIETLFYWLTAQSVAVMTVTMIYQWLRMILLDEVPV